MNHIKKFNSFEINENVFKRTLSKAGKTWSFGDRWTEGYNSLQSSSLKYAIKNISGYLTNWSFFEKISNDLKKIIDKHINRSSDSKSEKYRTIVRCHERLTTTIKQQVNNSLVLRNPDRKEDLIKNIKDILEKLYKISYEEGN